ncbi:MAG: T9SS type A sorting domain-containing protein [Bacteroidota bacterium]
MKKVKFILIFFSFMLNELNAQPDIQWEKSYGGINYDYGRMIIQTTDNNYAVIGYSFSGDGDVTGSHGSADIWISKLDSSGTIIWQKALGGTKREEGFSIIQTNDNHYLIAGQSRSNDGDVAGNHSSPSWNDIWIVKLDSMGILNWQKCLGGSNDDGAYSIIQTRDGKYMVAGTVWSNNGDVTNNYGKNDYWIIKLDTNGTIIWQKNYGGSENDAANTIIETSDGGYLITGASNSVDIDVTGNHGNADFWVIKLDSGGVLQWQKSLGGSSDEWGKAVIETTDGQFIVVGTTSSDNGDVSGNHGSLDYWVVKLEASGNIVWQKTLGGSSDDEGYSIIPSSNGGYIVAGFSCSNDGDIISNNGAADYWIVNLDSSGIIQWQKNYGGTLEDKCYSISSLSYGQAALAGESWSDDGNITNHYDLNDYWIVKLNTLTGIKEITAPEAFLIYPNPASAYINIDRTNNSGYKQINIYSASGQKLFTFESDVEKIKIDISKLSSGIYFITITDKYGRLWFKKTIKNSQQF